MKVLPGPMGSHSRREVFCGKKKKNEERKDSWFSLTSTNKKQMSVS